MSVVTLTPDFGWVVLVCVGSVILLQYLGIKVGMARRKYNVPYPTMYSDKEQVFNCIQRAHQNTLEVYPLFLTVLILGGLQHPCGAAIAGVVWLVARLVYAYGYYTGEPKNRTPGALSSLICLIYLLGAAISFALHTLRWI